MIADDMVLFAEASMEQMHKIMAILSVFSNASGQQINLAKSNIFFSNNVKQIASLANIAITSDLGRYLVFLPYMEESISSITDRYCIA